MIKFVILDIYPNRKHRLIKDTAGGYGTGNDFGNTLFSKLLNVYVDTNIGMPAIEIMIISSILKNKHKVHYTRDLNDKEIENCDFVIMPSSIIAHETEIDAIHKLKNKKIFVTGIFATTKREKYLVENTIVVKNESDTFFYNLEKSDNFNLNFLNELFNKKDLINEYYSPVELDDFPYPDWGSYSKKFPLRNDFFSLSQKIAVPLLGTRGCPYSCFFYCTYPLQQGRKVRARSVENIIEEIKYWKKELGTNKFVFRDPVFSINRKHTIAFCKKVIEEKLDITFMVETHLNNLDDEMIPLLRKAGLELVYVGVESSSDFVLKDMQRFTVEHDKQYKVIKNCEDAGIKVKTMFIIGNPEDNKDTIVQSIEYAKYLPSLYSQFSVFTPYPGTPAFDEFKDIITESKLENFNQYNLTFKHKNLSKKNISDLKSLAYFRFYFNFKKIFQIIKYFLKSKYEKKHQWVG
ncbi:radical SAM protein [Candidatus Pelagibacter bacterium]|nr:radical SAM protein [Candidatus Pelagibacter bacterium]